MLNQRVLASLLAVTTVTTTLAFYVAPSYGKNVTNVRYLAQRKNINWRSYANTLKSAIDLYQQAEKWGVVDALKQFLPEADSEIRKGNGNNSVPQNQVTNLKNILKASDFTNTEMKAKLQNLKNRL
ncbi:hypothetical protein LC609_21270 [Nostoc sp. XA013]|nr:hypothetical protein [Nostoc sp. XA013]